ncbi:hypothetical protein PHMEG_00017464 [Phytophthora megakarya]|uniref:Uncharacterized protein n=1 Tax=Phytophthora megakarya TaxID=4795 RepID=A0A225VYW6_9STRA|nr:hypothetical protein PHMEG_00017464 [Phytophthora megakarya]
MEDAIVVVGELYDSRVGLGEKKVAESKDARTQPDSEEEIQDAYHVTLDGTVEDGREESAPVGSGVDFNSDSSAEILGATQHMQFAHALPAGMVFKAQGGVTQPESSLGVQVTEAVLLVSPMPANPDDVGSRGGPAFGVITETPTFETFKAFIQAVAKSVDQVGNDEPLKKVVLFSNARGVAAQVNQRVDQAFQAIQMLAARPGVVKSVTVSNAEASTAPVQVSTGPAEAVSNETTIHEVARALKVVETQFEERWQRREAKAEKAKESWATNLQKSLNDQWESVMSAQMQRLQEEITSLKEARNQDQKANRRSKNVLHPRSSNAIKDDAIHSQDTSGDSAFAAQLQLTLPSLTETKYEKRDVRPKEEQGSRIVKTSGSRVKSPQTETKSTGAARSEDKEPPKKELRTKPSRQDEDPSGPSSSGESSEEDDSSSDSDSSSDDMPPYTTMVTNAKGGNMHTLRTFTNALDDFDEKQSLTARRRWWEKFLNMTIQAGKRVRTNWGRLAREFKGEYCKSRVSDSNKYYTMKEYKDETALAFLYRLNLAAERADVKFRKSERRREQHTKRFIKNLTDMSLRSTLQSQRFYKVSDLEYVLKQQEERNSNRAYVAQDDEGADVEQPAQGEQDVGENDAAFQELSAAIQDAQILYNPNGAFLSREELILEVYRIMNNVGWKPANPNARSGSSANPIPPVPPPAQPAAFQGYQSYNNPNRLEFCEKCK